MVAVAILAAGRGTRMKSELPKVLHRIGGKTLLERVLGSCETVAPTRRLVIVGYQSDRLRASLTPHPDLEFVEQAQQLGTGHAMQQLLTPLGGFADDLLVLNGDVPLLRPETIAHLLATHRRHDNSATLLTAQIEDPKGYGRVFCDHEQRVEKIIEDRDCTPEQRANRRINAGIYCFNWPQLAAVLPQLSNDNDQQEYYLTDVFGMLDRVMAVDVADLAEITGINDRRQLAIAADLLQTRIKDHWMRSGVTLINPDSITIDDTVTLAPDVIIEPQTHLRGNTAIATGCHIGPGSLIENSTLGENVTVLYSVISDSTVAAQSRIGPYAHLRGHATVGEACRIGNFVELKKTELGRKTNVSHLSYLGDATVGDRVNIGAGTITANYDGVHKHQTVIGSGSKTGSNSVLVAPLTLGEGVTIAAGSTVTENVGDDALVIARARQVVKPGWRLTAPNG
ncbi:MAG: bifunctional UDP-N-acetylglucosamine diphosphorylase/glucosamine-1-phosphate N-acetyltransferase GlmU [Spirulina sp. DLM2.Bin59]|nr:MAG: bifunctional UDP-N-acetylglucosamine diphosphorylase/glucosamine-1-phosphate N-acetyltransferase GlmU [Spirulina sp. DLM2.Bin59]